MKLERGESSGKIVLGAMELISVFEGVLGGMVELELVNACAVAMFSLCGMYVRREE